MMDPVAGDILLPHRGKGAIADVEGDLAEPGASFGNGLQQFIGKVQARRRGGHRPRSVGVNRLIAPHILGGAAVPSFDIRRQGHLA